MNTSSRFAGKEIVLGITGSIAAYKACELASRLVEYGAQVTPVLTRSATELVGPATLEAITGRRAILHVFEQLQNPQVEHIAVATRADLFIIAPATANILAKAAHGMANDWITTTILATRAPILFAPAMNSNMYTHPATQENIAILERRGCHFIGPDEGRLACRTTGPGRLIDVGAIIEAALPLISCNRELAGKHVLITSGPTHEPIDPVRFIGNRSSGKMGATLALEALARGARVTVVSGPATTPLPHGAKVVSVETAEEMAQAVREHAPEADIIIGAAAVADYRVAQPLAAKHERSDAGLTLELTETPDIIAQAAANKRPGQVLAGFAAETGTLEARAQMKLTRKGLDLIVANIVGTAESGFGAEHLTCLFAGPEGPLAPTAHLTKQQVAERLFDEIVKRLPK